MMIIITLTKYKSIKLTSWPYLVPVQYHSVSSARLLFDHDVVVEIFPPTVEAGTHSDVVESHNAGGVGPWGVVEGTKGGGGVGAPIRA